MEDFIKIIARSLRNGAGMGGVGTGFAVRALAGINKGGLVKKKNRKFVGKYDWSGSCAPSGNSSSAGTFSVGIFTWEPNASASGLKKSAVVYRVRGYVQDADKVFERAEYLCDQFDSGRLWPANRKSEFVK